MFNEAFWFFYWIGIIDRLPDIIGATMVIGLFGGILMACWWIDKDRPATAVVRAARVMKGYMGWLIFIVIVAIIAPTPAALYAGAGLNIAEQPEVTDTLFKLKTLVDQKLDEAIED